MYMEISDPMVYHAALYIRLSKEDENEGPSESVTNQKSLLDDFVSRHRLVVYDTYVDDGYSGTTFDRNAPCTRAEAVTYIWKACGAPAAAKAAAFTDVTPNTETARAVSWAVEVGVTNGTGDGTTFSPADSCTRGHIVTFLYRAMGLPLVDKLN